jgi:hypothetical protein
MKQVRSTIPLHRLAHQTPLGPVTSKEARVVQLISLMSRLVMDLFLEALPIMPLTLYKMSSASQVLDPEAQPHPVAVPEHAHAHNPQQKIALRMRTGM